MRQWRGFGHASRAARAAKQSSRLQTDRLRAGISRHPLHRYVSTRMDIPFAIESGVWESLRAPAQWQIQEAHASQPVTPSQFEAEMLRLLHQARSTVGTPESPSVLVSLSGGVDSMALAALTAEWAASNGITASALVVDHSLRAESAEEAAHVAATANSLGLPCRVLRVQWGQSGGRNGGWAVQAAARRARQAAISLTAAETGARVVLLGHHGDDATETTLMRMFRASGVAGLAGIRPVSSLPVSAGGSVALLRPLLPFTKSDLIATCGTRRLLPLVRWDPSNDGETYDRVRVRRALERSGDTDSIGTNHRPSAEQRASSRETEIDPQGVRALASLMGEATASLRAGASGLAAKHGALVAELGLAIVDPHGLLLNTADSPSSHARIDSASGYERRLRGVSCRSGAIAAEEEQQQMALSLLIELGGRDTAVWRAVDKRSISSSLVEDLASLKPGGRRAISQSTAFEAIGQPAPSGPSEMAVLTNKPQEAHSSQAEELLQALVILPLDYPGDEGLEQSTAGINSASDMAMLVPGSVNAATLWSRVSVHAWRGQTGSDGASQVLLQQLERLKSEVASKQASIDLVAADDLLAVSQQRQISTTNMQADIDRFLRVRASSSGPPQYQPEAVVAASAGDKFASHSERGQAPPSRQTLRRHRITVQPSAPVSKPHTGTLRSFTEAEERVLATTSLLLTRPSASAQLRSKPMQSGCHPVTAPLEAAVPASDASLAEVTGHDEVERKSLRPMTRGVMDMELGAFLAPPSGLAPLGLGPLGSKIHSKPVDRPPQRAAAARTKPKHHQVQSRSDDVIAVELTQLGSPSPVLDQATSLAHWLVGASGRLQSQASAAVFAAIQDIMESDLATRTDLNATLIRALTPFACAAPTLVVRTLSRDSWEALQHLLSLPAQPFAISRDLTLGAAVVLSLPPVKLPPSVLARDLIAARFLTHVPSHAMSTFAISPALLAATEDDEAASQFFGQNPRLQTTATAFAEARSVVAVPALGVTLDPRLDWHISRHTAESPIWPTADSSRAQASSVVEQHVSSLHHRRSRFSSTPLAGPTGPDRSEELLKAVVRSKGVTRTKLAKLESAVATVNRNVVEAAIDCGGVKADSWRDASHRPRWFEVATIAADEANATSRMAFSEVPLTDFSVSSATTHAVAGVPTHLAAQEHQDEEGEEDGIPASSTLPLPLTGGHSMGWGVLGDDTRR